MISHEVQKSHTWRPELMGESSRYVTAGTSARKGEQLSESSGRVRCIKCTACSDCALEAGVFMYSQQMYNLCHILL